MKKLICILLALLLALCLTAGLTGCADDPAPVSESSESSTSATATEIGTGAVSFTFEAVERDGTTHRYLVHTDAATVGDALLGLELIAGDDGAYGLYVKSVCGIRADYDLDGTYWAFYENGSYATAGVDKTPVTDGASYAMKVEK